MAWLFVTHIQQDATSYVDRKAITGSLPPRVVPHAGHCGLGIATGMTMDAGQEAGEPPDHDHGRFTHVNDTSPAATARYFELLRQAGPAKRLEICASLTRAVREMAIAGIKSSHPGRELDPHELREKLAERLYGAAVAGRVFARRRP